MTDILLTVEALKFLNEEVFELTLTSPSPLPKILAGQFVHVAIDEPSMPLRRPFCIAKWDSFSITLIIAVVGEGTRKLSTLHKGDTLLSTLPLGNGFQIPPRHKKVALVGGGVGCAPLLGVYSNYPDKEIRAYLGFANKQKALFEQDFKSAYRHVTVSTDDGSYGFSGYVTDAFLADYHSGYRPDIILTCGSDNMIKAVAAMVKELKIPTLWSGEIRMGCGVGACLVCACAVREGGEVKNRRACMDGPVFNLEDVVNFP